eukprot:scaffold11474_cov114-Isochrysis_galbana.AAC.2
MMYTVYTVGFACAPALALSACYFIIWAHQNRICSRCRQKHPDSNRTPSQPPPRLGSAWSPAAAASHTISSAASAGESTRPPGSTEHMRVLTSPGQTAPTHTGFPGLRPDAASRVCALSAALDSA